MVDWIERHDDALPGTDGMDGSAGEVGAPAASVIPPSQSAASVDSLWLHPANVNRTLMPDSRLPLQQIQNCGPENFLEPPRLNHALAAEGARLVADLCARHRRIA